MIVEDEGAHNGVEDFEYKQLNESSCEPMSRGPTSKFSEFLQRHRCTTNRETHSQLQLDIVEHLW